MCKFSSRSVLALCMLVFALCSEPAFCKDKPTTLVFPSFLHTMGIRKATRFHLMLYTRNRVKVRSPEGIAVARLQSWDDPTTEDDDDEVTGYGVNSGANVIIYNKSMTALGFYGLNERGERKLLRPTAVAANERGDVYVADTGKHRIVRLFNPKAKLDFVQAIGTRGQDPGQFEAPQGVALDESGTVYTSDTGNDRIQVFDPQGNLAYITGEKGKAPGRLWRPTAIAVTNGKERWSHYKDAFIAVVDLDGSRVQTFTLEGKPLKSATVDSFFAKPGLLRYPAIDYYSNIWVTDMENHCIHKFDRHLNYLTSFGRKGGGDREFNQPRGIAFYKRFGQVFIAEKESAQYYWVGCDVFEFSATFSEGEIILRFFLTEPSFVTLAVETPSGKKRSGFFKRKKLFAGNQEIHINTAWQTALNRPAVSRDSGSRFTEGKYLIKLQIEPTYSSLNYFLKEVETSLSIR